MKMLKLLVLLVIFGCSTPQQAPSCYGQINRELEECLHWQRTAPYNGSRDFLP
jgi:hypothetical protein